MIGDIKHKIRAYLTKKEDVWYLEQLNNSVTTYDAWIREKEAASEIKIPCCKPQKEQSGVLVSFSGLKSLYGNPGELQAVLTNKEYVILVQKEEMLSKTGVWQIQEVFEHNSKAELVYGDEDEKNHEETVRMNPWLKPDYSPQTLLSYFYFGSLVAIRKNTFEEAVLRLKQKESKLSQEEVSSAFLEKRLVYALVLEICGRLQRQQVIHIKRILSSSHGIGLWGFEEEFRDIRQHYDLLQKREKIDKVSIIIPSKDNPNVLNRCLDSIVHWTEENTYEILVVDNGSSPENKEKIEILQRQYGFHYVYEPMEFNFSLMCNLGAKRAKHDMLLFLNDDCEARGSKWLPHMLSLASLKSVGAVGAKLYYPKSKRIQHCGISQLFMGPVHKLQFKEDVRPYYDRRNLDVRNVLAVTAACLMVRKSVFEQVNGFDESLKVAFNDVDFCYKLYETGYENVVDNEIHLWHHESLSRGSDESPQKLKRLWEEKKRLYKKHTKLWKNDPYYHPWFTADILDIGYSFAYEYSRQTGLAVEQPVSMKGLPAGTRADSCVVPMIEYAGDLEGWFLEKSKVDSIKEQAGETNIMYLQGNAVVLGSDNACYLKWLLLRHDKTGEIYRITPDWYYRPDVFVNLPDQKNVGLSGFACLVNMKGLPAGRYEMGVLVMDKISKQYLLCITTRSIENGRNKL